MQVPAGHVLTVSADAGSHEEEELVREVKSDGLHRRHHHRRGHRLARQHPHEDGLIANIVVGVVGSLIGQWGAGALAIAAAGTLASWIVSLVGAVVLIAILRAIGVFT